MREIKFRAWSNITKEMIYPDFPDGHGGGLKSSDILERWSPDWIMQFTGLLDKNKREIYEGDIAKITYTTPPTGEEVEPFIEYTEIGEMKWVEAEAQFQFYIKDSLLEDYFKNLEVIVIGNIYENPDLLTAKAEGVR